MDLDQTVLPQSAPVSETLTLSNKQLIWTGIKLFCADAGLSVICGFIFGFIVAAFIGAKTNQITQMPGEVVNIAIAIGTLVSAYIAYIAYKKYSQNKVVLITLVIVGFVMGMKELITPEPVSSTTLYRTLILCALTVVAYGFGWYLASKTEVRLPSLGKKAVAVFTWIGGIYLVFAIIGQFSKFTNS